MAWPSPPLLVSAPLAIVAGIAFAGGGEPHRQRHRRTGMEQDVPLPPAQSQSFEQMANGRPGSGPRIDGPPRARSIFWPIGAISAESSRVVKPGGAWK